jgi:hypothetical protein
VQAGASKDALFIFRNLKHIGSLIKAQAQKS